MPDAVVFKNRVGQMIDRASVNPATGRPRKVRIFGEMVSLLYVNSNTPARLEEFWEDGRRSGPRCSQAGLNERLGSRRAASLCIAIGHLARADRRRRKFRNNIRCK